MTRTLDDVRATTDRWAGHAKDERAWRDERDDTLRRCYAEGNATLRELAEATGLSKQRIWQIVEGE